MNKTFNLTLEEYIRLRKKEALLYALEQRGLKQWEYYREAKAVVDDLIKREILMVDNEWKAYISTKIIKALFEVRSDGSAGYKIRYPDGYVSWCPEREFNRTYREINNKEKDLINE